jgi:hypothetical protein
MAAARDEGVGPRYPASSSDLGDLHLARKMDVMMRGIHRWLPNSSARSGQRVAPSARRRVHGSSPAVVAVATRPASHRSVHVQSITWQTQRWGEQVVVVLNKRVPKAASADRPMAFDWQGRANKVPVVAVHPSPSSTALETLFSPGLIGLWHRLWHSTTSARQGATRLPFEPLVWLPATGSLPRQARGGHSTSCVCLHLLVQLWSASCTPLSSLRI